MKTNRLTSENIDGSIHCLQLLKFQHSVLAIATEKELLVFSRLRVFDTAVVFLILGVITLWTMTGIFFCKDQGFS